jgi:hypothetical protein
MRLIAATTSSEVRCDTRSAVAGPSTITSVSARAVTVVITRIAIASSRMKAALGCFKLEMVSTSVLGDVFVHGCVKGIESKGGFLNVARARVGENTGGGIIMDAGTQFSITNSIVYRNGTDAGANGGVSIGSTVTGINRFEHNTVVDNLAQAPAIGGVRCTLTNKMELAYNIIAGNAVADTFGCVAAKSVTGADTTPFNFKSTTPPYDYHLTAGSSAIDQVELSNVNDDVDGQFRPLGLRRDFGADEYKP